MSSITDAIDQVAATVRRGGAGTEKPWAGAEIIICEKAPRTSNSGDWRPDPRFVETNFVGELSWMFNRLAEIFRNDRGYGGWKEEFFGRLGNVTTKYQSAVKDASSLRVLQAVLHEAYAMAEEIDDYGSIETLPITSGNAILDDYIGLSDLSAYLNAEETQEYLRKKGFL